LGIGPEANIHTSLKIDSLVSSAETSKREKYTDRKGENQGPEKVARRRSERQWPENENTK
jgi:hypothetical protein